MVLAMIAMRRMRRALVEDISIPDSTDRLPLETYNSVIQQLKQQKHELQSLRETEQRRAKTSENISTAVLSNLSSGVMFFTPNGLIRQANAAARQILGFASPAGMNAKEIFREAAVVSAARPLGPVAEVVETSLRSQIASGRIQAQYLCPGGDQRILEVSVTPVHSPSGDALGAACLITDQTEMATIRRDHELRVEISTEMALELRTSLNTISEYAQQLASIDDPVQTRIIAADIVSEANHLDHTIGGFLLGPQSAKAAHS